MALVAKKLSEGGGARNPVQVDEPAQDAGVLARRRDLPTLETARPGEQSHLGWDVLRRTVQCVCVNAYMYVQQHTCMHSSMYAHY